MGSFDGLFMGGLYCALFALALWAAIDALSRPATGYLAAGKLTKQKWVALTVVSAVMLLLMTPLAVFVAPVALALGWLAGWLWLPAVVASVVYLVDVRPALRGMRRGNRNW